MVCLTRGQVIGLGGDHEQAEESLPGSALPKYVRYFLIADLAPLAGVEDAKSGPRNLFIREYLLRGELHRVIDPRRSLGGAATQFDIAPGASDDFGSLPMGSEQGAITKAIVANHQQYFVTITVLVEIGADGANHLDRLCGKIGLLAVQAVLGPLLVGGFPAGLFQRRCFFKANGDGAWRGFGLPIQGQ